MYLYIYDAFLSHQRWQQFLEAVERRVTDLGIAGKIARLTILKNIRELVQDAVRAGVKTIVAIGDDQTFTKMINVVADLNITLGLIPATTNSNIARALGIPPRELACDVLAARIVRKIDLGKINDYFFLDSAHIVNADVRITGDGFSVKPLTRLNTIQLCNVRQADSRVVSNPTDGVLEAVITPVQSSWLSRRRLTSTILPFTRLRIDAAGHDASIITDDQVILKTPARVEIVPRKLKVIVGSRRCFD